MSETVPFNITNPFTYSVVSPSFEAIGDTEGSAITGKSLSQ